MKLRGDSRVSPRHLFHSNGRGSPGLEFPYSAVVVFLVLSTLYIPLLPLELTRANFGGDGGDFLAAILTHGVAHPGGYPTYLLLGEAFQFIPLGTIPWRGALLSAISTAFAGGLVSLWVWHFLSPHSLSGQVISLIAGLAWGSAPLVWSQAVIVEVHGLQALMAVIWLWWVTLLRKGVRHTGGVSFLSWIAGLSLGNHLTIFLFIPALIATILPLILKDFRGRQKLKFWLVQGLTFLLGASVYLLLPLRAQMYPPINWGNPQSWEGFWWVVSGQPYRGLVFHTSVEGMLERISAWARILLEQFGLPGLVLGVLGAVISDHDKVDRFQGLLLWVFGSFSAFAIGYDTPDSLVYLIPALLAGAVWVGKGAMLTFQWHWRGWRLGWLVSIGMLVFLLGRLPETARQVDPRMETEVEQFAREVLQKAPTGALILTEADEDTFPLWYAHFGLGERPDVQIIVLPLTQFLWYRETLRHIYPDLHWPSTDDLAGSAWGEALPGLNAGRPVCRTHVEREYQIQVRYECR
ncbi:MAG TPA: DUF2723 domain-containing protein [Anaerolinea thermolimosa]|uniref:DUF2723 domain-containing protein n=1 Tax=Anaerolinea thermolimosa TaxID=229919 RepID=A0A3D1JEJ9_9CHLR|nr:hypothetical protein ATHL_02515 [Anaerolinea thermolimosa]HCE16645.1 DUF2723 domain-containing protein [Anaerolinea thermolimosa]